MVETVQNGGEHSAKRIVACACGQKYRVPAFASGGWTCRKCGRALSATAEHGSTNGAGNRLKVFVSYSRKDHGFVLRLSDALQANGIRVFRDLDDILPTEEWWPRIESLITAADTVVFAISPDSVSSKLCARELALCHQLNKRVAPIVLREVPADGLPDSIARLNHVFFTAGHDFDRALRKLASALQTDIGWIREHTRIGELARRWDDRGRKGGWLEGEELVEAEAWRDRRPQSAPHLTELQRAFLEQSRQAASDRARSDSDVILGANLHAQKNYAAARDAWTRAANLGNPAAMTHIGKMLTDGVGVAADPVGALNWFEKAAELGDLEAMIYLGALREWGDAGEIDLDEAARWYRRAAEAGQLQAMSSLATLLLRRGNAGDEPEARRLLSNAAEAGYPIAMNVMGEVCLWRDNDPQEAERWFQQAAESGNAMAMVNLGAMHEERPGAGAAKAAGLYRRAANLNNPEAMFKLGELCLRGTGVDRDFSEATRLFVKAAELGHRGAQEKLAQNARAPDGSQYLPPGEFITCPQCNTRVRKSAAERALENNPLLGTDPFAIALECPNCRYPFRADRLRAGAYASQRPPRGYSYWIVFGLILFAILAAGWFE